MSIITGLDCVEKNYSYQHLQGTMLLNLNKLSSQLKLSHSDYRVIGTLIGLYNKNYGKAFPTIEYLAKYCCMGKSTLIKSLNSLVMLNLLVVVKTPGKRNNYYFSNLILSGVGTPHVEPPRSTACKTVHDNKQIKRETNIDKTIHHNNLDKQQNIKISNDDVLHKNTSDLKEYKEILTYLKKIGFTGGKFAIKKYGIQKLKDLINITQNKNPNNPGAYLRSLLNLPNVIQPSGNNVCSETKEEPLIRHMLKHQYWRHISSDKILQALPDIGQHLLIRFNVEDQTVIFVENNFTDKLESFEVATKEDFIKQNSQQENCKVDKVQIIKDMIEQGKVEEAKTLSELWRIRT